MAAESSNNTNLIYRLTFGGFIGSKGKQPDELQLNQGVRKVISDDNRNYYMLLCGVKVNRKIYQPTEIEAELDFTHETTDAQNKKKSTAPNFNPKSLIRNSRSCIRRCQSSSPNISLKLEKISIGDSPTTENIKFS